MFKWARKSKQVKEKKREKCRGTTESIAWRTALLQNFTTPCGRKWDVIGASVAGMTKTRNGKICEDYCSFLEVAPGCGAIFSADGAGSARCSRIGSKYLAKVAVPRRLKQTIEKFAKLDGSAPESYLSRMPIEHWRNISIEVVSLVYADIKRFSEKISCSISDLSSTIIVCIIIDGRVIVFHIGDGRGAFRNEQGKWESLFEPFIGTYEGDTVFLTSLHDMPSREAYIDTRIHFCDSDFICIMTDGCERASFVTHLYDEDLEKYHRSNQPYPKFFDAMPSFVEQVLVSGLQAENSWAEFLSNGTPTLTDEGDDKTLVVALRK